MGNGRGRKGIPLVSRLRTSISFGFPWKLFGRFSRTLTVSSSPSSSRSPITITNDAHHRRRSGFFLPTVSGRSSTSTLNMCIPEFFCQITGEFLYAFLQGIMRTWVGDNHKGSIGGFSFIPGRIFQVNCI
jgi:hypothetical protein